MDFEVFTDSQAVEKLARKPRRKKSEMPLTKRERGEIISPEATQRAIERNKTCNPVKVVHGLRMTNLLTAARCSDKFCPKNDYKNCDFRADEKLPAAQRHCPIPQWIYNEKRRNLEKAVYGKISPEECGDRFDTYIHECAFTLAYIEWGRCMQAAFGGFSATLTAEDNTPLGNINRTMKSLINKLLRIEDKLGGNPQDLAKLKKDLYETESIVDKIARLRAQDAQRGIDIPQIGEPEWDKEDVTDAEFTEIKPTPEVKTIEAGVEPYTGNPFTGDAATVYDKLKV